jgi:hypothetical protein
MPCYDSVNHGDSMAQFTSGALRSDSSGKGRYDLISVHGIHRLAKHYENGVKSKYPPRNWERGLSMSRYVEAILRHTFCYLGGDRSEDHLAAIAWNAFCLMDHEERIERGLLSDQVNDLPKPGTFYHPDEFLKGTAEDKFKKS